MPTAAPLIEVKWERPAVGAYNLYEDYRQSLRHAETTVQLLASETSERVADMLAESRVALEHIAAHEATAALQGENCGPIFAEFPELFPVYRGLTVRTRSGEIVCNSSRHVMPAQAVMAAPWFRNGLASNGFRLGSAYYGQLSGRWITLITVPVRDGRSDAVSGLLVASIDLSRLSARLLPHAPAGAVINVVDRRGHFVLRNLDTDKYLGADISRSKLARLLKPGLTSTVRTRGIDGVSRIYAVGAIPGGGWRVATGLPEDDVLAAHRTRLAFSLIVSLVGLVLALASARWAHRSCSSCRRARAAHAEHVRRFGASDVSARRMDPPGTAHALRADGTECPVEATISKHVAQGQKFYTAIVRDISERVAAQQLIARQNDFYAALSRTNRAIVQATDPQQLMLEICRICVEHGHATVAYIAQVQGTKLVPMAWAGPADDFLADIPLLLDPELPEGDGPIARAVRSGAPYVANDFFADPCTQPWRGRAAPIETRSTAAVPFRRAGAVAGALSLHMSQPGFFDDRLVALLDEMADDLSFALDTLDRSNAERAARDRFEKIFNAAPVAANISALADGRVLASNDAACRFFGYTREEFVGRTALELGIWENAGLRDALLARVRAEQRVADFDARFRLRSGEVRDVQIAAETIEFDAEPSMLIITSDITERKRYEAHITHLANYDGLTGLPNRNLARDRIEQAIAHARRAGRLVGLVYLDLDRFKVLNDGFGHAFGDALLTAAGERLTGLVRDGDTVARFSGDEFIIVLADVRRHADMYVVAQKLLDAFDKPFALQGREVHVNFSVGVSVYPHDGEDFATLVGNADVAMYRAKAVGGSTYQFFTTAMGDESQQRVALETRLRNAIPAGQMSLAYQPRVDLRTGRIIGCEALLRWTDPEDGPVSPARFIPAAEESGLIVTIGDWVLRTACAQARAWRDAGLPDLVMSVNVSVRQFLQPDVAAWVLDALRTSGLAPRWLELELTESLLASDTEKVIRTIAQLDAEGVNFSIDDFGTGYSSLAYLKRFRVDTLKIDQSFIRDMLTDPNDEAIARAVIGLAHSLHMRATAEGVETAQHVRALREHGCDEMQGYFFSKPVPASEFEAMLRRGKRLD